jgi:hypothetical protein
VCAIQLDHADQHRNNTHKRDTLFEICVSAGLFHKYVLAFIIFYMIQAYKVRVCIGCQMWVRGVGASYPISFFMIACLYDA